MEEARPAGQALYSFIVWGAQLHSIHSETPGSPYSAWLVLHVTVDVLPYMPLSEGLYPLWPPFMTNSPGKGASI